MSNFGNFVGGLGMMLAAKDSHDRKQEERDRFYQLMAARMNPDGKTPPLPAKQPSLLDKAVSSVKDTFSKLGGPPAAAAAPATAPAPAAASASQAVTPAQQAALGKVTIDGVHDDGTGSPQKIDNATGMGVSTTLTPPAEKPEEQAEVAMASPVAAAQATPTPIASASSSAYDPSVEQKAFQDGWNDKSLGDPNAPPKPFVSSQGGGYGLMSPEAFTPGE